MTRSKRDRIVVEYLPLVKAIAVRVQENLPACIELGDLLSAGTLGLIDAVSKFDSTKNVPFASYAKHRIRGAILDSLRQLDWASRTVRQQVKCAEQARQELTATLKRDPTEQEMAEQQGLTLDEWRKITVHIRGLISASTRNAKDDDLPAPDFPCPEALHPDNQCLGRELSATLQTALDTLKPRYRQVMELYYQQDLTMHEIGAIMGVNESRVSQMHKRALEKLQTHLKSAGIDGVKAFAAAA